MASSGRSRLSLTMRQRGLSEGYHPHALHLLDQWGHQARKAAANEKFKMISISDREKPLITGYMAR